MDLSHVRKSPYLELIAAGEPFRLLFPIGTAAGILGVLLWPLHAMGWMDGYPLTAHTRIMVEGFLAAFVFGFLGTALPRMLEVARSGALEIFTWGGALVTITLFHFWGWHLVGDILFLVLFLCFLTSLLIRAQHRKDTPPPGFVLVAMGMLCGIAGTALHIAIGALPGGMPPWVYPLARTLLYQGFLLLPVMGVGAFLLPRFFGLPNRHSFPESLALPPGWTARARFAALCGIVVVASFALEALGYLRTGYALRAIGVLVYLIREVPVHQARFSQGSLARTLRVALAAIPLGYLALAVHPGWQLSLIHVVFITGFSLLTFTVASRVVLGHSGRSDLFAARLKAIGGMAVLLVLALGMRLIAEAFPAVRIPVYAISALLWIAGALIWAVTILPRVRYPDTE